MKSSRGFWASLDRMVAESQIIIDRPQGSNHPQFTARVYPLDYGHMDETLTSDGGGIDLWVGSLPGKKVTGVICTIDLAKNDAEIKVLISCTPDEAVMALEMHNIGFQSGLLITRAQHAHCDDTDAANIPEYREAIV